MDTGIPSLVKGLDYMVEGPEIVLDFPAGTRDFSFLQRAQIGPYLVGN